MKNICGIQIFVMIFIMSMVSGVYASGNSNNNNSDTITGDTTTVSTNVDSSSVSNATTTIHDSGNLTNTIGSTDNSNYTNQDQHQSNSNDLSNFGNSSSNSSSNAYGGSSNQTGTNTQNQSANNQGNSQSSTNNFNTHVARNNPNVTVFAPNPTSPCMMSFGGGGAGGGFGVMITGTVSNENCEINEAARIMNSIGQTDTAIEIACTGKHARDTRLCREVNANKVAHIEMERSRLTQPSNAPISDPSGHSSDDFGTNVVDSREKTKSFLGFRMDRATNQYRFVGF